jgi:hypothetical protein
VPSPDGRHLLCAPAWLTTEQLDQGERDHRHLGDQKQHRGEHADERRSISPTSARAIEQARCPEHALEDAAQMMDGAHATLDPGACSLIPARSRVGSAINRHIDAWPI